MSRLRLRIASLAALVLLFGFLAVANFIPEQTRLASPLLPDDGLRLGLDLRGGIHWVLGVKLEMAERHELDFLSDLLRDRSGDGDFSVESVSVEDGSLVLRMPLSG